MTGQEAKHAVLMGDPLFFSIKGGANPHTRTFWGRRKSVSRKKAVSQWHHLAGTLTGLGVEVFVLPAVKEQPGLVYPANAGFLTRIQEKIPIGKKTFYLSNLLPTRTNEKYYYKDFLGKLGLKTQELFHRFEGEADFFPLGDKYIFTYGPIQRQRFVFQWGIPPYRRVYGFRTDKEALAELSAIVVPDKIIPLGLINEAFYHGDTLLCSFGHNREFLLAYLPGLEQTSQGIIMEMVGDKLVKLETKDAWLYAANSFQVEYRNQQYLIMPEGVSAGLLSRIEERGVIPVLVNVSEFWKKGGGSVKCMIGDLGYLVKKKENNAEIFQSERSYQNLFLPC
jgi:N-dimethylarginine dimethylaminohydrolase